jgi:hypothetical protein
MCSRGNARAFSKPAPSDVCRAGPVSRRDGLAGKFPHRGLGCRLRSSRYCRPPEKGDAVMPAAGLGPSNATSTTSPAKHIWVAHSQGVRAPCGRSYLMNSQLLTAIPRPAASSSSTRISARPRYGMRLGHRRQRVRPTRILEHVVWLPPLAWQERIVAIRARLREAEASRARNSASLDALLPSILNRPPTTNSEAWPPELLCHSAADLYIVGLDTIRRDCASSCEECFTRPW